MAETAPNPTTNALIPNARYGFAKPAHQPRGEQHPIDEVVRVVPPPNRVIEVQGIARGIDEERQGQQNVGGVRVSRPSSKHCPNYGDYQGGNRVYGQPPENALPSNCCNPEKAPIASRPINMAFTAKLTQNSGESFRRPEISRNARIGSLTQPVSSARQPPWSLATVQSLTPHFHPLRRHCPLSRLPIDSDLAAT